MSTPDTRRTLGRMSEETKDQTTYVTRPQAAELAGVSERTINRWAARLRLRTYRRQGPWGPAEYDAEEVVQVAGRETVTLALPDSGAEAESDIST